MKIQYVKVVRSPRALAGEMHQFRDLPDPYARQLIDEGYAVTVTRPVEPVAAEQPAEVEQPRRKRSQSSSPCKSRKPRTVPTGR